MTRNAFFVDLPNFYSRLLKSEIEEPRFLRDYFLNWLDLDLLARALSNSFSGIWVFYSGQRIGPSSERIEKEYLQRYIDRINKLKGVTACDVNIPGQQREPVDYTCEKCKYEGTTEAKSEKGVDAALTVHLFDTMDSWDVAYLLSGDADFVPAVKSLRRRGKIVIGAGFTGASSALIRECYEYVNLVETYILKDIAAYALFGKEGVVWKWFTEEVVLGDPFDQYPTPPDPRKIKPADPELSFGWNAKHQYTDTDRITAQKQPWTFGSGAIEEYRFQLGVKGAIDLTSRIQLLEQFSEKFSCALAIEEASRRISTERCYHVRFPPVIWEKVARELPALISSIPGCEAQSASEYSRKIPKETITQ